MKAGTMFDVMKLVDMCLNLPTCPSAQQVGDLDGQARIARIALQINEKSTWDQVYVKEVNVNED